VSRSVYVASPEGLTGKSAVALGLLDALTREVGSVGVFRPLTTAGSTNDDIDLIVDLLVNQPGISQSYDEAMQTAEAAAAGSPV
jgi:phosphate acetyltransferase